MESLKSRPLLGGLTILGYAAICLFIISAHHGLIINDMSSIHTKPAMFTVSYVTSLWAREPNSQQAPPNPHRREVEAALMANIHNPYFDQIVVFLDGVSQQSNCIHFIQDMRDLDVNMGLNELEDHDSIAKVTCVNVEGDQPPYYQMFMNAVSDHVLGDVVVMSNADQAFDYSVAAAHNLNPDVLAVLSTRGFSANSMPQITSYFYRIVAGIGYLDNSEIGRTTGVNMCGNNPYSWDSFIFHKNTLKDRLKEGAFKRQNTDNENVYFYMNEMGAENAALWALEQSFPFKSIWNACDMIHSWDFHLAPKMHNWKWKKKIKGAPRGSVPYPWGGAKPGGKGHPAPSKHPQCISERNCFLEEEEGDRQQHQQHEQQLLQLNAQPWPTILDTKTITLSQIDTTMNDKLPSDETFECEWSPLNHGNCDQVFKKRLPPPTKRRSASSEKGKVISTSDIQHQPEHQRWLFFGDSTVAKLFQDSVLKSHLITNALNSMDHACWSSSLTTGHLQCEERRANRCSFNELFNIEYAEKWIPPEPQNFEGPLKYGLSNPFCQDCSGCNHNFLHCIETEESAPSETSTYNNNKCYKKRVAYGGYFSIEFARDVEIQSPQHKTTQENVASYLSASWNEPSLLDSWGLPICVISTGHHDAMIPNIGVSDYIHNVRWYISIMRPVCGHIIWLANTAPGVDNTDFPQTVPLSQAYNNGVRNLIQSNPTFLNMMTYMNVFSSSLNWPRRDHIHMDEVWYRNLGKWFTTFM